MFRIAAKALDNPELLNKRFYKNDYPSGVKKTLINHLATFAGRDEVSIRIIIKVLDAGADPSLENPLYHISLFTTWMYAADILVRIRMCKVLLAYGADPNSQVDINITNITEDTCSVLGSYCHWNDIRMLSIVKMLLEAGADAGCNCFIHMGKRGAMPHTITYPESDIFGIKTRWCVERTSVYSLLIEANF